MAKRKVKIKRSTKDRRSEELKNFNTKAHGNMVQSFLNSQEMTTDELQAMAVTRRDQRLQENPDADVSQLNASIIRDIEEGKTDRSNARDAKILKKRKVKTKKKAKKKVKARKKKAK